MLIGYIGPDGLAYDRKWRPIVLSLNGNSLTSVKVVLENDRSLSLDQGEQILWYHPDNGLSIQDHWRDWGFTFHWEGIMGYGPFYITNQRIVHYREPKPGKHIEYSGATLSLPDAISEAMLAKGSKARGMMEFCEIPFYEIAKIETLEKKKETLPDGQIAKIAYVDIVYKNQRFRIGTGTHVTQHIEWVLKSRELNREVIGRGKKTVIWYVNPEDVDEKKLARLRKEKKKVLKKARKNQ